jgi:uncharacterized protein
MSICPICGKEVTPRSANKAFPFCTARCKSIDLGKWLNEDYRVPATPDEAGEGDEGGEGGEAVMSDDETDDETEGRDSAERRSPPKADMRH